MADSEATTAPERPKDLQRYRLPIRRPVTIAMLFLTLLVFGWRSYEELPLNLMPDISYPTLTVRTEYEGAAPEDVEKLVTRPIEERLSIVNGVVELGSVSSAGLSEVIMEFSWDTDMDVAMQDVRESLDLFDPPDGVTQNPAILRFDPTLDPIMRVALTARDVSGLPATDRTAQLERDLTDIRESADRYLKSDLEAEPGIAQVRIKGGREEEVQILLDSERLKTLGVAPESIVLALQQQNVNLSGGRLREGRTEYLVRTLNEFDDVAEIRNAVVGSLEGQQFRLEDIARVRLGAKERDTIVRVNGQEVVELEFYKEGSANVVQVSEKLQKFFRFSEATDLRERMLRFRARVWPTDANLEALERLEREQLLADRLRTRLPGYVQPVLITDQARFIKAAIREVQSTAILGGLLALGILFVFLREIRSTVIIGVAIPISVIATFVPMFIGGISLNIMSLGGLALGVGMLVDNSIVVLESIFRCREEGDGLLDAAERGTKEVAGAVTASTLTTIAVFFPIVFVEGIAGQIFRDLAWTVTFSLLASLSVALLLIPMIASRRGLRVSADGTAVWILDGFHAERARGRSGVGAVLALPRHAGNRARRAAVEVWTETAGLSVSRIASGATGQRVLHAMLLVPNLVLFVLQTLVRAIAAVAVTAVFLVTIVFGGLAVAVGALLRTLFAVPFALFARGFEACRAGYAHALRHTLRFSPVVLLLVLALSIHAGRLATGLGRELIPPMRQGEFTVRLEAPPGTRLEDTERRAQRVEALLRQFEHVDTVTMQVGQDDARAGADEGENIARLTVKLRNPEETARYQDAIIDAMRRKVIETSPESITFSLPSLFTFNTGLEVQIFGEELGILEELGRSATAAVTDVAGLKDVELSLKRGYPEIHIVLDREMLATKSLEPYQVAELLRTEVQGDVATQLNRAGEKIDIRVRADETRLAGIGDLKSLSILDGFPPTPLESVARIEIEEGPSEIRRIDQRQVALLTANVEGRDLGSVAAEVDARLAQLNWPRGYAYALGGQNRELETSYNGLLFALALAVFLVYVVMACQFESIFNPLLIMFSVPLAFIGVVYGLWYFDLDLSVVVFIGGIVLAGIVVNAAIVLVDYINQLRERGFPKHEAIVQACSVRFRPIMMTAMTTILGLIPMAISTGEGAEIRRPMAITVMAGLVSATILTLVVVPVVYKLFGGRDRS